MPGLESFMVKWKNAQSRKGMEWAEVDGMSILRRKGETSYWLHARRGNGPIVDDWGPFEMEEANPFRQGREWNEVLRGKGWFSTDLATGDTDALHKAVARLPRSTAIPRYLLDGSDNAQIARGKGRTKSRLCVGGVDVHRTDSVRGEILPYADRATISVGAAGSRPRSLGNHEMSVDGPSLEALIDFLISIRLGLVSSDALGSIVEATFGENQPLPENMPERVQAIYRVREDTDRLMTSIMKMSPAKRELVAFLVDQVESDDLQIGVALPEGVLEEIMDDDTPRGPLN
jgi:hypothetical protein